MVFKAGTNRKMSETITLKVLKLLSKFMQLDTCAIHEEPRSSLTLRLLMSYIYGAPSKARNANVVYIWTYVWQR